MVRELGEPALELSGGDVERLWERLADLEDHAAARASYTTAHHSPAALTPLLGLPLAEACVFHAACGRLHVFPDAAGWDESAAESARFARVESRGVGTEPAATTGAIRGVRQRIRAALDPGECFALGERWVDSTG